MNTETETEIAEDAAELAAILGCTVDEALASLDALKVAVSGVVVVREPKAKVCCKVCGFHKRPRKGLVETGICKVCTLILADANGDTIVVQGRMGKKGRNTVSIVDATGTRIKVKRVSKQVEV